jgi:hypothetical protein
MELKNILPSSEKLEPIITLGLNFRFQPIPGPIYMLDYRSEAQIGAAAQQNSHIPSLDQDKREIIFSRRQKVRKVLRRTSNGGKS